MARNHVGTLSHPFMTALLMPHVGPINLLCLWEILRRTAAYVGFVDKLGAIRGIKTGVLKSANA